MIISHALTLKLVSMFIACLLSVNHELSFSATSQRFSSVDCATYRITSPFHCTATSVDHCSRRINCSFPLFCARKYCSKYYDNCSSISSSCCKHSQTGVPGLGCSYLLVSFFFKTILKSSICIYKQNHSCSYSKLVLKTLQFLNY